MFQQIVHIRNKYILGHSMIGCPLTSEFILGQLATFSVWNVANSLYKSHTHTPFFSTHTPLFSTHISTPTNEAHPRLTPESIITLYYYYKCY